MRLAAALKDYVVNLSEENAALKARIAEPEARARKDKRGSRKSDAGRVAEAKPLSETGYRGLDHDDLRPSAEAKKLASKILEFTAKQYNDLANRTDLEGDSKALVRQALIETIDAFGSLATEMWQGE